MEIVVTRKTKGEKATLGEMAIDGKFFAFTLEDKDRGLDSAMAPDEIKQLKVQNQTAIPTGRYKLEKLYWEKFKRSYPHLLDVPGFAGVLVHSGLTDADTEGCVLVGSVIKGPDAIDGGFPLMDKLRPLVFDAIAAGQEVWITIKNNYAPTA